MNLQDKRGDLAINIGHLIGYLSDYEIMTLQVFAKGIKTSPPKIVNIGGGAGTSGIAFVEARPDAVIWTIDSDIGSTEIGLEGEKRSFADTGLKLPQQILGNSAHIGNMWKFGQVDIVFVDGDHSPNYVVNDIKAWHKHVKRFGHMIFHDYGCEEWPGIKEVVDEVLWRDMEILVVDTLAVYKIVTEDL